MDLFVVVKLAKPTQVAVGVRPLRDGEAPVLEATAGRTMELELEEPGNASPGVLEATPVTSVPNLRVQSPESSHPESAHIAGILRVESDSEEASQGVKRKKVSDDGDVGTSKRRRHTIAVDVSSDEDVSPSNSARDTAETSSSK